MKKLIGISVLATMFAACGGPSTEEIAKEKTLDSLAMVVEQNLAETRQQKALDSMNDVLLAQEAATASAKNATSQGRNTHVTNNYSSGHAAQQAPAATKRKGWSGAATGAAIGAGVGAVSGALIDDKKGRGAVIGGISGAGIGAGTGAIIDANKKKKAAQGKD